MKTYPFDSIERFSRFSETRNIKKLICGKKWLVFDEPENSSESYTFMANGTVMIGHGSNNLKCNWEFNSKTKTLALSGKNSTHLFQLIYFDKVMMVLKVDGDNLYSFFIYQNNEKFFAPRFYTDIVQYFRQLEKNENIEVERLVSDTQNPIAANSSEEFQNKVQERQDILEKQRLQEEARELFDEITQRHSHIGVLADYVVFTIVYIAFFTYYLVCTDNPLSKCLINALFYGSIINVIVDFMCINKLVTKVLDIISVKRWKRNHPNDPRNLYL